MRSGSTADDLQPINIIRNDGRSYIVGYVANYSRVQEYSSSINL